MADRTFPLIIIIDHDFSIVSAFLTVVRLRIKLCILDVVIDKLHNFRHRFQIIIQVRNLYIRNTSSGADCLELAFKCKFVERIDLFTYIHMIGVRIVSFVGHICDASEFFLVNLGKTVAQTLCRCSVKSESKSCCLFPCIGRVTESLHHLQSKLLSFFCRLAFSCHQFGHFIKSDISKA